jgi:penicillin-binding protein A
VVQRTFDLLNTITRGSMLDRNGRILVEDRVNSEGNRIRFYTEPSLAHLTGYLSGMRTGVSGLELTYNESLLGLDRLDAQLEQALHQPIVGSSLVLTIDSAVQRAAAEALANRPGAVVALDGQTGAVLAMVSNPAYDPNQMQSQAYVSSFLAQCEADPACSAPFINRATQGRYTPGSTWKTLTLIAALDSGLVTPETVFDFGEPRRGPNGTYYVYEVDGGIIPDPNHPERRLDLVMSYAKSANAAFARMGDELGGPTLLDYAQRMGFSRTPNQRFPLAIEFFPSQLVADVDEFSSNNLLRAATAIGQGELLTHPMGMALIVLPVLNDGSLPLPYFIERIEAPTGRTLATRPGRRIYRGIMSRTTARQVHDIMITAVEQGFGRTAQVPGLRVGGKTGTAQLGGDLSPHAWFIGFAENDQRSVVIAVIVENAGQGSQAAAPVFAQVARAAFSESEQPVQEVVPTPVPPTPTPTPEPTATPVPQDQGQAPSQAEAQPTPTPTADPSGLPAPDITRDPNRADITAGAASCPITREITPGTGQFIWPSRYQALSGTDFMPGHPGIDLSAPQGSPVYAADSGTAIFAGWTGDIGYGNTILIDHGNGYRTLYAHLSQVSVPCGKTVERGQFIGFAGSTGNSSGPHLHFEVRVPGGWINPLRVLPTP